MFFFITYDLMDYGIWYIKPGPSVLEYQDTNRVRYPFSLSLHLVSSSRPRIITDDRLAGMYVGSGYRPKPIYPIASGPRRLISPTPSNVSPTPPSRVNPKRPVPAVRGSMGQKKSGFRLVLTSPTDDMPVAIITAHPQSNLTGTNISPSPPQTVAEPPPRPIFRV